MRVNIYCCLVACVLGCRVSADLIHKVAEERQAVNIRCQHVKNKVTWSRERNGSRVDILTADGDRDIKHIKDGRFTSLADKTLSIININLSDSGKYLCNNEEAVKLTVIPSGTRIHSVTERTSFSLNCPHDVGGSHGPTWSREIAGTQNPIRSKVSSENNHLIFSDVRPGDSGLYYCDGKPAGYLNVTKDKKPEGGTRNTTSTTITPTSTTTTSPPTSTTTKNTTRNTTTTSPPTSTTTRTTSTTTTTPTSPSTSPTSASSPSAATITQPSTTPSTSPTSAAAVFTEKLVLIVVGAGALFLVLIIITAIIFFTRRVKRRETDMKPHVYEEIPMESVHPTNGLNPGDPTYATISDLPAARHTAALSAESPYCLITDAPARTPHSKGPPPSETYSLLQKPL